MAEAIAIGSAQRQPFPPNRLYRQRHASVTAVCDDLALLTLLTPLALLPPVAYSVRPRARKNIPWLLAMIAPTAFLVAMQVPQAVTGPTVLHA